MPRKNDLGAVDSESTSTTLIEQLKSGDEDTWSYFLFAYRPLIISWATRTGANESDAADIAQEVVSNVVRGISEYEKGERTGSFRKWAQDYHATANHRLLA